MCSSPVNRPSPTYKLDLPSRFGLRHFLRRVSVVSHQQSTLGKNLNLSEEARVLVNIVYGNKQLLFYGKGEHVSVNSEMKAGN